MCFAKKRMELKRLIDLDGVVRRKQDLMVEEAGVPGENHRPWISNW
jgi:hypothetical protein